MTLLVGPIASGKSTYAAKLADAGALVVNDDAVVTAVHGGRYTLYDPKLKPLYTAIESDIIYAAAMLGRDVVIDRGCRTRAVRARFATAGRSLGFEVGYHAFPFESPETHAKRRVAHDPRGMDYDSWLRVAREHHNSFQPVLDAEGLLCFSDSP